MNTGDREVPWETARFHVHWKQLKLRRDSCGAKEDASTYKYWVVLLCLLAYVHYVNCFSVGGGKTYQRMKIFVYMIWLCVLAHCLSRDIVGSNDLEASKGCM